MQKKVYFILIYNFSTIKLHILHGHKNIPVVPCYDFDLVRGLCCPSKVTPFSKFTGFEFVTPRII